MVLWLIDCTSRIKFEFEGHFQVGEHRYEVGNPT